MVMVHHFDRFFSIGLPFLPSLAVDVFFVLSGYVLSRAYESRIATGETPFLSFMAKRYRRLAPALFIGCTIGLAAATLRVGPSWEVFAAYLALLVYIPSWWMFEIYLINGPAWSLTVEIFANALQSLFFAKSSTRTLIIIWAACFVVHAVLTAFGLSHWGHDFINIVSLVPRCLVNFLSGILIWRLFKEESLPGWPVVFAFPLLGMIIYEPMIDLAMMVVMCPLIVRCALSLQTGRWADWLGILSYPLYVTHVPVLWLARIFGIPPVPAFAIAVFVAGFVAWRLEPKSTRQRRGSAAQHLRPWHSR